MGIKDKVKEMVKDNETLATPVIINLKRKQLWGVPFYKLDLALMGAFIAGSLFVKSTGFRIFTLIMIAYCAWGAYIDYKEYQKRQKK